MIRSPLDKFSATSRAVAARSGQTLDALQQNIHIGAVLASGIPVARQVLLAPNMTPVADDPALTTWATFAGDVEPGDPVRLCAFLSLMSHFTIPLVRRLTMVS